GLSQKSKFLYHKGHNTCPAKAGGFTMNTKRWFSTSILCGKIKFLRQPPTFIIICAPFSILNSQFNT
ncbi:MAG: hypothetical protein LBS01_03705, partial [Prevotellaceae bacterium]|nr:hypothetical protein [Prevotellaceae bacterium]